MRYVDSRIDISQGRLKVTLLVPSKEYLKASDLKDGVLGTRNAVETAVDYSKKTGTWEYLLFLMRGGR